MTLQNWSKALSLLAILGLVRHGFADQPIVTDALIAASPKEQWLSYGRDYNEQRYSPLEKINDTNVASLGLAWYADLDTQRPQEATPLVHDGVLYISTAWSMVKAYNAATGQMIWSFDPKVPRETLVKACCDAVNRGVAIYGDKVFVGTLDGRLIAINRSTGEEIWSTLTVDPSKPYTITGAPRAMKDMVVIGNGGAEMGVRGYVSAYDAGTGKMRWRFYTVPDQPGKNHHEYLKKAENTWRGEWWKLGGGGTVWDSMAYDPDLDLLYIGVGNGSPWNQSLRSPGGGDNLYLSSIVALRATTGEYVWHFQTTPGETWDYTATQHIILADLKIGDGYRKVLMQAPKNGFFYLIDRVNGEFLDVNWAFGLDPETGRPVENPDARYDRTGKSFTVKPGSIGAHNWHPMSFSPKTGLVYIPVQYSEQRFEQSEAWRITEIGPQIGVDTADLAQSPFQAIDPTKAKGQGGLVAWDPVGQRKIWQFERAFSGNGGTMVTGGNLVFQGTIDGRFQALSADVGKLLWDFNTHSKIIASPVTYSIEGVQYVAVLSGPSLWGILPNDKKVPQSRSPSRLLVFKLNSDVALENTVDQKNVIVDPPPYTGSKAQYLSGARLYGRYCAGCHGPGAVSSGTNPDLRFSGIKHHSESFEAVVLGGVLASSGMVSFSSVLSQREAESVRQYLIKRANEDRSGKYD